MLIAAGAIIDAADNDGQTPLHRAAAHEDPLRLKALLAAGANPNATDQIGRTPLMCAAEAHHNPRRLVDRVKLLIDYGADARLRGADGRTALDRAQASLEYVCDPEVADNIEKIVAGARNVSEDVVPDTHTTRVVKNFYKDVIRTSRGSIAEARKNLPIAIRLLQEHAAK